MVVEEAVSAHPEGRVAPIGAAPPPSPDLVELAELASRAALGLASLVAGSVTAAVAEAISGEVHEPADEPQPDDGESWPKPLAPIRGGGAPGGGAAVAHAARADPGRGAARRRHRICPRGNTRGVGLRPKPPTLDLVREEPHVRARTIPAHPRAGQPARRPMAPGTAG